MGEPWDNPKTTVVADIYNRQLLERVQHGSDKVDVGKIARLFSVIINLVRVRVRLGLGLG